MSGLSVRRCVNRQSERCRLWIRRMKRMQVSPIIQRSNANESIFHLKETFNIKNVRTFRQRTILTQYQSKDFMSNLDVGSVNPMKRKWRQDQDRFNKNYGLSISSLEPRVVQPTVILTRVKLMSSINESRHLDAFLVYKWSEMSRIE